MPCSSLTHVSWIEVGTSESDSYDEGLYGKTEPTNLFHRFYIRYTRRYHAIHDTFIQIVRAAFACWDGHLGLAMVAMA